jgi:hypothetical protein
MNGQDTYEIEGARKTVPSFDSSKGSFAANPFLANSSFPKAPSAINNPY